MGTQNTISKSSILKTPGGSVRGGQRVRFEIPKNFTLIFQNYHDDKERKPYDDLLSLINAPDVSDDILQQLLVEVRANITLLNYKLNEFVGDFLKLSWSHRCKDAVNEYQGFLLDLLSAHNYYTKPVLESLVENFKPVSQAGSEVHAGELSKEEQCVYENVHRVIKIILQVVPMSCDVLLSVIVHSFPYYTRSTSVHQCFLHNVIKILCYQPKLRVDLLHLITSKLIILDVNAPRAEIETMEDGIEPDEEMDDQQEIFPMDHDDDGDEKANVMIVNEELWLEMKHPVAKTLDLLMEMMFCYVQSECVRKDEVDWEKMKTLYRDLILVFDKVILPTHATHHVQFLLFYICSFKLVLSEAFLNFLWRKVSDPNVPSITRQSAASYIASFLARANFVPLRILKASLSEMAEWIHGYISNQDGLSCVNTDVRIHAAFYAVCQALFYVIAFRHKELVNSRKNLTFLQSLNLSKIVTSRLNPLGACLPAVVQNFASVTRTYQLVYCYTVIEHNNRSRIPLVAREFLHDPQQSAYTLETFFPFDPYLLLRSASVITPIYREYEGSVELGTEFQQEDDDDYLDQAQSSSAHQLSDFLCHVTSPGFKRV